MKVKLLAASVMLLSGLAVAADSTSPPAAETAPASTQHAMSATVISFKPFDSITNDDVLSASTGGAFKGDYTSYENDGNENTTTRAGLQVRKSSVIVALQHNLGIDVSNHVTDKAKFISAVNKILPAADALTEDALNNLDLVVISAAAGTNNVITDVVPDSKTNPIVDVDLKFTLVAKPGTTIGGDKAAQLLVLEGKSKVKLTDYRRVDQSTMQTAKKAVAVSVGEKKPAGNVTYGTLTKTLDSYFDITAPTFETPLFPIWNVDPATDKPVFVNKASGEPVKHSLNKNQINALAAMYTGPDGKGSGDFSKARIERAVQKVTFVPAGGKRDTDRIIASQGAYEGKFDVTITFIQHWSWNKEAYSERAADFTLKDVPVKVTFKK